MAIVLAKNLRLEDDTVDALYEAAAEPGLWKAALDRIVRLFDAQAAALVVCDHVHALATLKVGAGIWDAAATRRYLEEFAQLDPAPAAFQRLSRLQSASTRQLFTPEEERRCAFYNEFYRPLGLVECLGVQLFHDSAKFGVLGIQRGPARKAFRAHDFRMLDRLSSHAARALQLQRFMGSLKMQAKSLADIVDRMTVGVIARDADGRVIHVGRSARAIAARSDGLSIDRSGFLRSRHLPADARLGELQRVVLKHSPGEVVLVPRGDGKQPYAVLVSPIPGGDDWFGIRQRGRAGTLVLVHDPVGSSAQSPAMLVKIFGLSPRGAELVVALVSGKSLKSYSEDTGLSLNTVRSHLKVVFERTGARTQPQLMRMVVRALERLGPG